jgi:hypothetical protein
VQVPSAYDMPLLQNPLVSSNDLHLCSIAAVIFKHQASGIRHALAAVIFKHQASGMPWLHGSRNTSKRSTAEACCLPNTVHMLAGTAHLFSAHHHLLYHFNSEHLLLLADISCSYRCLGTVCDACLMLRPLRGPAYWQQPADL